MYSYWNMYFYNESYLYWTVFMISCSMITVNGEPDQILVLVNIIGLTYWKKKGGKMRDGNDNQTETEEKKVSEHKGLWGKETWF